MQHHHPFQHHFSTTCSLVREPRKQRFVARSIANLSFARSHPVVYPSGFSHLMLKLWANLFSKKFASLPSIPSVNTTKGVKDARHASAALLYFRFFSSSAEESTAAVHVFRCICNGASYRCLLLAHLARLLPEVPKYL